MRQYLQIAEQILNEGERTSNRTGVDTIGLFGAMMKFDLREGFPLLTTKKVLFDTVVDELLWFIRGGHNVNDLDAPKKIWDAWADAEGELGRIYGVQWRDWDGGQLNWDYHTGDEQWRTRVGIDQLQLAIERVKSTPNNRQNIVSAWNVGEIERGQVGFKPCHVLFQLRVMGSGERLDLAMYQRSCDWSLGVPFNIASYALLLTLIANECGLTPGVFTHFLADAHIYVNHLETMKMQLMREPRLLPTLLLMNDHGGPLQPGFPVVNVRRDHIQLSNYHPHGFLKYDVVV